jgi:acetyltransferase-like isoleucine patch superfamily enzyme
VKHPTVVTYAPTVLGQGASVGPFCVLGYPDWDRPEEFAGDLTQEMIGALRTTIVGRGSIVLSHVVIGEGTVLDENVWIDHHTHIGSDCQIGAGAQIMYGARIYHRVTVGAGAWVAGFICNDAVIAGHAVVLGQLVHKFTNVAEKQAEAAPTVREEAFVGMGAVVIGGIEVGEGAYIAAGAVLTTSAKPRRLYRGVPAKEIGPAPCSFVTSTAGK